MKELAEVIRKFESIELLVSEIEAYIGHETVEGLVEYLEDELYYSQN